MNKEHKKGILLPETLKIIIAVLCIVLLIYLLVKVYGLLTQKSAIEQAKESIKVLELNIEKIEKGEKQETEFFLESPNKWVIAAWPRKEGNKELKPSVCKKKYCICLCPVTTTFYSNWNDYLSDCEKGICSDVNMPVKTRYLAEPPQWYKKAWRNIKEFFGSDTENVPIDINGLFPLKAVNENGITVIKREKNPGER